MAKNIITKSEQIVKNQSVPSNCRSIKFEIKTGAASCFINNEPLVIGQPLCINLYPGEVNTTVYQVRFSGAGDTILYVTRELEV